MCYPRLPWQLLQVAATININLEPKAVMAQGTKGHKRSSIICVLPSNKGFLELGIVQVLHLGFEGVVRRSLLFYSKPYYQD